MLLQCFLFVAAAAGLTAVHGVTMMIAKGAANISREAPVSFGFVVYFSGSGAVATGVAAVGGAVMTVAEGAADISKLGSFLLFSRV